MEEVDKLIETMAKKIREDIILGRNTDKLAERVTGLAALITASANHRMMRKYNKLQQKTGGVR